MATICLGPQSLTGSSGTPILRFGLALGKDLAVSPPLFIPMAELGLLAWDRACLVFSNQTVSVRTSALLPMDVIHYSFTTRLRRARVSGLSSPMFIGAIA